MNNFFSDMYLPKKVSPTFYLENYKEIDNMVNLLKERKEELEKLDTLSSDEAKEECSRIFNDVVKEYTGNEENAKRIFACALKEIMFFGFDKDEPEIEYGISEEEFKEKLDNYINSLGLEREQEDTEVNNLYNKDFKIDDIIKEEYIDCYDKKFEDLLDPEKENSISRNNILRLIEKFKVSEMDILLDVYNNAKNNFNVAKTFYPDNTKMCTVDFEYFKFKTLEKPFDMHGFFLIDYFDKTDNKHCLALLDENTMNSIINISEKLKDLNYLLEFSDKNHATFVKNKDGEKECIISIKNNINIDKVEDFVNKLHEEVFKDLEERINQTIKEFNEDDISK